MFRFNMVKHLLAEIKKALGVILLSSSLLATSIAHTEPTRQVDQPNFVVILVDDASFTDFGAFGGEADTPNIDALAASGQIFSNFHASPLCGPSRAMLLTGLDNHLTGMGTIPEIMPDEQLGQPGYTGNLQPGVVTVADRLQEAGYQTYMTGKWHLGHGPGDFPNDHGFDRSFILDAFGGDHYSERPHVPALRNTQWYADGEAVTIPEDFYSSEYLIDQMIEYIDEGQTSADDDPFFAYVGFLAVQRPIQVPSQFTEKYIETYADGWEAMRQARWERAQALDLIPPNAPLDEMPASLRSWDDLSAEEKAFSAKQMAAYAGMLEAMDFHFGRLVAHLKATGEFENTVFVIASDNGPEGGANWEAGIYRTWASLTGYTYAFESLGERGSYNEIGPEWALASASPTRLFKSYASEGGIRVPLIISGPGIEAGPVSDAFSFITDITPTVLDMAEVSFDPSEMTGRSLLPLLEGEVKQVYGDNDPVGMEVSGNAALFKGDWKITRNRPPWGRDEWALYHIARDPGETLDLSLVHPEIKAELIGDYETYARQMGVLDLPEGYDVQTIGAIRTVQNLLQWYWWLFALVLSGMIATLVGLIRFLTRRAYFAGAKTVRP